MIEQLRQGGYVIVFRHAATNRDQADTDPFNYANITAQRLLSTEGRATAKQIGAAFRSLHIPIGRVYTSKFRRAAETGMLMAAIDVTATLDLTEGGLVVTPIENDRRADALKKLAATPPPAGTNTLIVTHKPNILDAFGKDWFDVREAEASIFRPRADGTAEFVARLKADDWARADR